LIQNAVHFAQIDLDVSDFEKEHDHYEVSGQGLSIGLMRHRMHRLVLWVRYIPLVPQSDALFTVTRHDVINMQSTADRQTDTQQFNGANQPEVIKAEDGQRETVCVEEFGFIHLYSSRATTTLSAQHTATKTQ